MSEKAVIGVVGGSGVYAIDGLANAEWRRVQSPWGLPSDELLFGTIGETEFVFLPRHGRDHRVPPTDINYRANIDALKRAGVTDVISVSACGSFKRELSPGTFVLVDQFIDRTFARAKSFFGQGCVAHVSMARPVCPGLLDALHEAGTELGLSIVKGGTYLAMEGPQFSTKAESLLYKAWGCDVIGMTNMPEAKLAREAELPYATVAMVTDYDCWIEDGAHVDVAGVLEVLHANADHARSLIKQIAPKLGPVRAPSPIGADRALTGAILTPSDARDPELVRKLDAVAGRVL